MPSESGGAPPRRQMTPEVVAGIQQLGVDPADERLMKLVDDLLRPESLPRGWAAAFDGATGTWSYTHTPSGQVSGRHPCYGYYQGAMFLDKGGYAALKANRAAYPPSEEEVSSMGAYFGIKEEEEDYVWEVAEMALAAPLPPGWGEVALPPGPGGEPPGVGYKHGSSGEVLEEHPLDSYFRELLRRRRRELMRRKKAALKAVNAIAAFGWKRSSTAAAGGGGSTAPPQAPQQQQPPQPPELSPEKLDALKAEWASVLTTAQQLVNGLTALPLTQHGRAMAAGGGAGGAASAAGHAGVRSPAVVPAGDDSAEGDADPEYATLMHSSTAASGGAVAAMGAASAAALGHAAGCSSTGCCCACHADPAGDVTRWLSQLAVTPAALLATAAAAATHSTAATTTSSGGAEVSGAAAAAAEAGTITAAAAAAAAGGSSASPSATATTGLGLQGSADTSQGFQEGAADLGGTAGAGANSGNSPGAGPWQLRRNSSIKRKLMQLQSVLSTATDKPDGSHLLSQQQPGPSTAGSTAVNAGQRQAAAQVNHRPSRLSTSTSNTQLWAAAAAGAGGAGVAAASAAAAAGGTGSTTPVSFSGFMSGGALEDDSGETAAMAHLGAIKATMQEALGFLGSWRQQQLVLGALQLQLQQAHSRLADRNTRIKELEAAQSELDVLRAAQEQQAKEGGDLAAVLQQQLQQSQDRCSTLDQTVLQLQQQLEAEQALHKLKAEEAAGLTQELTSTREQLEEEQQLRTKEAAESAQKVATLTADLTLTQQQLAAALDQVAALQQLTSRLSSDSESAASALTGQLQQLQAELTTVKSERDTALLEVEGLRAAAAEAAGRVAALEGELSAAQQQAAGLQAEVAALTASLQQAQAAAARPPHASRWTQTEPPPPRPHWRSAPGGGAASSSGGGGSPGWPSVSPQRGLHSLSPNRPIVIPVRRDSGGWDSSPIPAEVRTRVDRAKDRQLKLKVEDPLPFLPPGPATAATSSSSGALPGLVLPGGGGSQSGGLGLASLAGGASGSLLGLSSAGSMVGGGLLKGRWEYAIDERDAEICSLKQRLVEVERRSREAAQRAEADVKRLAAELQSAYKCLGTVAVSQSGGLDLQQAAANLRATLSNYGGGGGGVVGFNSRASALQWGRSSTAAAAGGSLSCPGGIATLPTSGTLKASSISACGGALSGGGSTRRTCNSSGERGSVVGGGGEGKGVRFSTLFQERAPAASTAVVWPSLMSRRWSATPAAAAAPGGDGQHAKAGSDGNGGEDMPSNSMQQQRQQQQEAEETSTAATAAAEDGQGWGRPGVARPTRVSMSAHAALSSRSRGSEEPEP